MRMTCEMSQSWAQCQYVDDEYKAELVEVGSLDIGKGDPEMDR